MKLTAIILIAACLQVSATGYTQAITLSGKNMSLEKVLKSIRKQTDYLFVYDLQMMQQAKKIDINVKKAPLEYVLNLCFNEQPFTYLIADKTIVLRAKNEVQNESPPIPPLPPPPTDVKGRVTNERGEPVEGATVTVKGTNNATATNANGEFELKGVDENATLVITGVNIETYEIKLNGRTSLAVNVKTAVKPLDEVVAKGYYTTSKRLNTGNVSKVGAETINKQPVANPLQTLQGRMPGVYIQQTTGVPGGSFNIEIRGRNSIRRTGGANDPLFIIDGVPFTAGSLSTPAGGGQIIPAANPLNVINPADIESIEVLKDADATAIYGSRGANGVVLITTKKGKAGKTKVDIDLYTGAGKVTRMMDLLNTQQYLEMRREAFKNDGVVPSGFFASDLLVWDSTRYTDWQEVLIGGTAHTTNAQASVSGGDAQTQFLFRGGYYRESTVFPGDFALQRGSGLFNLTHVSPNKKFNVTLSANYSVTHNNLLRVDLTSPALSLPPNAPTPFDNTGNLNWENSTFFLNPFRFAKRKYELKTNNLVTNARLSYMIIPGLKLNTSLGYTNTNAKDFSTEPINSKDPAFAPMGTAIFGNQDFNNWIIEPQAEYQTTIGSGRLSTLVGATFQESVGEGNTVGGFNYTSDALLDDIRSAPRLLILDSYSGQYRYTAVFGRINYDWQGKYIVNLTARRDGSSRFGPGRQFGNFGAGGAAWIFSNESFIQHSLPFLSFGKLRVSYGITGSDAIGDYEFLDTYNSTSSPYQGAGGLQPTRLFNPDFRWETNKKIEAALETGFLSDRILFSASYYRNRSSSQLVGLPLPASTGFTSIQSNLPATVQNTGWELELNTTNIKTANLTWTTTANFTRPRNKLIEYPNIEISPFVNTYIVGEPLFIRRSYHVTGVDPQIGVYTFEDVDRNGNISYPLDLKTFPVVGRKFYGGLNNSFTYKGWQLDIFFQFVKQTIISYFAGSAGVPGSLSNQPTVVMNRWRNPGDITDIQRFTQGGTGFTAYNDFQVFGDNGIIDGSFIRLKNLSLTWQLPVKWIQKVHLQNCKIYIQGQNLFIIIPNNDFLGMDPEQGLTQDLPPLRMLAGGIQLTF